jgi:hypothetical protein
VVSVPKRPVKAAIETVGLNLGIWAFDRYVLEADYAYIGWNTIRRNLRHNMVWDNDEFSVNLLLHPYQGGMYYNAARANGMSIGNSALYAVGGSLVWEYFLENESPSLNDFISTPLGGIGLGEITFRLANLLVDSRSTGWERFGREFLGFVVNPVHGINRIISGDAWRIYPYNRKMIESLPLRFTMAGGYRGLYDSQDVRIDNGAYIDFDLLYGNIFSVENERPYDAFSASITLNMVSNQPLLSDFNFIGELWGKSVPLRNEKLDLHWGVFQHFDYYNSGSIEGQPYTNTYRIAEAAAFGIGGQLMYKVINKTTLTSNLFVNAVLLGSSITDHYRVDNRDYNLSSGFSTKFNLGLNYNQKAIIRTEFENYRLFTWNETSTDQNLPAEQEPQTPNLRGDEGNTGFTVINLQFFYLFRQNYFFTFGSSAYLRNSHYRYYPDVQSRILDSHVGVGYYF